MGYVGPVGEWRQKERSRAGPSIRTSEHGECIARPKHRSGRRRRYYAWRRMARAARLNVVVRRERKAVALEMEQQAITGLDMAGNDQKRKKKGSSANAGAQGAWDEGRTPRNAWYPCRATT